MTKRSYGYLFGFGSILFIAGCLAACSATSPLGAVELGGTARSAVDHGQEISAEGWSEGNPVKGIFGSILQVLGGLGIAAGGTGYVAKKAAGSEANKKIAAFDAAPETVAFAPDGTQVPIQPKA